jgi:uncharacterized protein (TIGR03067 family)
MTFEGSRCTMRFAGRTTWSGSFVLDPSQRPASIDLHLDGSGTGVRLCLGIYEFVGDDELMIRIESSRIQSRPLDYETVAPGLKRRAYPWRRVNEVGESPRVR